MLFINIPEKKYLLGIDLKEDSCQVSYMTNKQERAVRGRTYDERNLYRDPVSYIFYENKGIKQLDVPACLCRSSQDGRWYCGEAARECAAQGDGKLVDGFLREILRGDTPAEGNRERYNPAALLALFLQKVLGMMEETVPAAQIDTIVFTSRDMSIGTERILERVMERLAIPVNQYYCENYVETFFSYVLMQSEDIREGGAVAFGFDGAQRMIMNRLDFRTGGVGQSGFRISPSQSVCVPYESSLKLAPDLSPEEKDDAFYSFLTQQLIGSTESVIFLAGDGFEGEWMNKSLSFLRRSRRIFQGMNLYSKGAAYSALLRTVLRDLHDSFFYLGRDGLSADIKILAVNTEPGEGTASRSPQKGRDDTALVLLEAGSVWYRTQVEEEFILESGSELSLIISPITGQEEREEIMPLEGLPHRPDRTTRLKLHMEMISEREALVRVRDLGFGTIFPASGKTWEHTFTI